LKADGSVDTSTYITSADGGDADQLDGQEGTYYLNYNNFTNTPTIPTNNNQLTNGANYITASDNITGTSGGLSGSPNIDCGTGSFTGDVDIADKIVHTGDTNTAIRFPSTDTVTIETSGSERLRVLSNGHVVIGDTNDTGFFRVSAADGASADQYVGQFENLEATDGQSYGVNIRAGSNSTDHSLRIKNRANDETHLIVSGNGNMGVGNATPGDFDAGADNLVVGSGSGDNGITIYSGNSSLSNLYFADGTAGSEVYAGGMNYSHSTNTLAFFTNDGTTRMSIDSSGQIFTGSTSSTFNVVANQNNAAALHLSGGGSGSANIEVYGSNHASLAKTIEFNTNNVERLRIGSSGQWGLGGANYGTSSQVLTSNGSGSAPTWQDAGGGAWNLIQTVNASGASTVNLTGIDNTYSSYCIKITDATIVPGSSGRMFFAQFMTGSTPSVPSSAGFYAYSEQYQNTPTMGDNLGSTTINYSRTWEMYGFQNPGDSFMQRIAGGDYVSLSNEIGDSENHTSIELHIMNPGEAYGNHAFWWHTHQQETNPTSTRFEARHLQGEGWHIMDTSDPSDTTGAAITGVRFTISRNNLDNGTVTGKFQLYGMS
jgi:hypothetical protein